MEASDKEVKTMQGEAVFSGCATHALDPKRRVTIPSGWRDAMGKPAYVFVMADPHEKCLRLLTNERMQGIQAKLLAKRFSDPTVAQKLRIIGANTEQLPLDVQGRIRISDRLLEFAGIKGRIAFVGAVTYGEIWAAENRMPETDVDQAALSDALAALDF
jgi:MraZ protein